MRSNNVVNIIAHCFSSFPHSLQFVTTITDTVEKLHKKLEEEQQQMRRLNKCRPTFFRPFNKSYLNSADCVFMCSFTHSNTRLSWACWGGSVDGKNTTAAIKFYNQTKIDLTAQNLESYLMCIDSSMLLIASSTPCIGAVTDAATRFLLAVERWVLSSPIKPQPTESWDERWGGIVASLNS